MLSTKDAIADLLQKEAKVRQMGGEKAVEKQKAGGKLTARERLDLLFDPGTFRELDMFVQHRCDNFGMEKIEIPSDGVVTGHGMVDGKAGLCFLSGFHLAGWFPGRDARSQDLQSDGYGAQERRSLGGYPG